MNNPLIYIAWFMSGIGLGIGLGTATGIGITCALYMIYVIAVDCTNGLIKAIQGKQQ
jgi:hypothetical protein